MSPILKALDHLSYVIECVALDYTGEAKHELSNLCSELKCNPEYNFDGHSLYTERLKVALICLKSDNNREGASYLSQVSRSLWQLI